MFKTDFHYLTKDFWAHDYGLHFIVAGGAQIILLMFNHFFNWNEWFNAVLLLTVVQLCLWLVKEICATVQHRWSFGLLPKSEPDYRDWRMSLYGIALVDLVYIVINLFAY